LLGQARAPFGCGLGKAKINGGLLKPESGRLDLLVKVAKVLFGLGDVGLVAYAKSREHDDKKQNEPHLSVTFAAGGRFRAGING
jgi:hypothetical protein